MTLIIYHNPRCSKSRDTLALIHAQGVVPEVIEYLKSPPDPLTLRHLLGQLGLAAGELIRTRDDLFDTLGLQTSDEEALIEAMCAHPSLIERPIVSNGRRAVLGRPPEKVLALLEDVG